MKKWSHFNFGPIELKNNFLGQISLNQKGIVYFTFIHKMHPKNEIIFLHKMHSLSVIYVLFHKTHVMNAFYMFRRKQTEMIQVRIANLLHHYISITLLRKGILVFLIPLLYLTHNFLRPFLTLKHLLNVFLIILYYSNSRSRAKKKRQGAKVERFFKFFQEIFVPQVCKAPNKSFQV